MAVYGLLAATALVAKRVSPAVTIVALAFVGAWYGSLEHEVIHGHPTPWRRVNRLIVALPFGVIVPFAQYRESHLGHHGDDRDLTDPTNDPESYYVSLDHWERAGSARRRLIRIRRTLLGRVLLHPWITVASSLRWCSVNPVRGGGHLAGVAVVLLGAEALGLQAWLVVVGLGYGGQALTLLRSFAEHRAVPNGPRSAVVHAHWIWRLLFLNNTLHLTHHRHPGVAWFELPRVHRAGGYDAEARGGAGVYGGYGQIIRQFLVRPFCVNVQPQPPG